MNLQVVFYILLSITIFFQIVIILQRAKLPKGVSGVGWVEIYLDQYTRLRVYNPNNYWDVRKDLPVEYILEEGTYETDGTCWLRYSTEMTKKGYEKFSYNEAGKCGCIYCEELRTEYIEKHGEQSS